jgi:AcrR family transcriptional regulator
MPKVVDHDKYRDELALRSFDIIAKKGIKRVSMRYLAQQLGVTTGVLYRYFPSKDQLFEYMFREMVQRNVAEVLSRINEETPLNERLNIMLDFVAEKQSYFRNLLMLAIDFMRSGKEDEALNILKVDSFNYRNAINNYLKVNPEYGDFLYIFVCGITYHQIVFPGITSFQKQANVFKKLFLPCLKPIKK